MASSHPSLHSCQEGELRERGLLGHVICTAILGEPSKADGGGPGVRDPSQRPQVWWLGWGPQQTCSCPAPEPVYVPFLGKKVCVDITS